MRHDTTLRHTAFIAAVLVLLLPARPPALSANPGQPLNVFVNVTGQTLEAGWTFGAGPTPTNHRLDFFSGNTIVAQPMVGAVNSVRFPIPPGTQGRFGLQVVPFVGPAAGPPSDIFFFDIGSPGCTGPPAAPTGLRGTLRSGTATVAWEAPPSANSFLVRAGRGPRQADLFNGNVGANTSVNAGGLPPPFEAFVNVRAQNDCGVGPPTYDFLLTGMNGCTSDDTTICAFNRFAIDVSWRTFNNTTGRAMVAPNRRSNDGGEFYFFSPGNAELLVQLLDNCSTNDRFWVFASGSFNVEVTLQVTDTRTGAAKIYENPLGQPFQPIQDTSAFATCP